MVVNKNACKQSVGHVAQFLHRVAVFDGCTITTLSNQKQAECTRRETHGQVAMRRDSSTTLLRKCPQRAAELIYLQLLADLQLAHFDKGTTFRDKFATSFASVCPNEKHHWISYYVRCQAKLGIKVLKNFEIVFFANDSANAKPVRAKTC